MNQNNHKCDMGNVKLVAPNGHEIDPCLYEVVEEHDNCHVEVLRCKYCGHVEISWRKENESE